MNEPHASEFRRLVRMGAGARDVQGAATRSGFAKRTAASDAFVEREENRVRIHRGGTCRLLEAFVPRVAHILDVGCSTGGSTVALATSGLGPEAVVGIDPDALSLRAAEVRAQGHGLSADRVKFVANLPGEPLPFASETFDLAVCVSVLEFVPTAAERSSLVDEMKRVVRPGGHLLLSTPNPLRLRDLHARRWLGDIVRRDGFPWATPPWVMRAMLADWQRVFIDEWLFLRTLERAGFSACPKLPRAVARTTAWALPWQKVLARKPPSTDGSVGRLRS
jgi:SAM-dependent methyltransferase